MDFQKDVIERSHQEPVLVDFWAEWCGPCRMLSPTLEALAEAQKGRWTLVKINTEEYPDLAQQFQVRSIPNCKLFYNGKVIDEFVGALTRPMLERWFEDHLPDPVLLELDTLLGTATVWPDTALVPKLEQFLLAHPGLRAVEVALAQQLLATDPDAALALVKNIPPDDRYYELAQDVATMTEMFDLSSEAINQPAGVQLAEARSAIKSGDAEAAMQHIIKSVVADKTFQNALPRRAAVALFRLLGEHHPVTVGYRRKFSTAMY